MLEVFNPTSLLVEPYSKISFQAERKELSQARLKLQEKINQARETQERVDEVSSSSDVLGCGTLTAP